MEIERTLEKLHPQELAALDFEVEDTYKNFELANPSVETFPEFLTLMGRFYEAVFNAAVYKGPGYVEYKAADVKEVARDLIDKHLPGGLTESFDRASEGYDGCLLGVLRDVADVFKKELLEKLIYHAICCAIDDPTDWAQRTEFAQAYLERFGKFRPPGFTPASAELLAISIEELVKAHVRLTQTCLSSFQRSLIRS